MKASFILIIQINKISNKDKDVDIKNRIYYFFNDTINIKNSDPNNIRVDETSYKNIPIYFIRYVMINDSKKVKINSTNPLYFFFSKVNRYFKEINKNKYLALLTTNEKKLKDMKNFGVKSEI